MRRARIVAVTTVNNLDPRARALTLEPISGTPKRPSPTPPPKLCAADRIRDALQCWLEEDM
jgi:hypothetical protein